MRDKRTTERNDAAKNWQIAEGRRILTLWHLPVDYYNYRNHSSPKKGRGRVRGPVLGRTIFQKTPAASCELKTSMVGCRWKLRGRCSCDIHNRYSCQLITIVKRRNHVHRLKTPRPVWVSRRNFASFRLPSEATDKSWSTDRKAGGMTASDWLGCNTCYSDFAKLQCRWIEVDIYLPISRLGE